MDSREEYRRYIEKREKELEELGKKYKAETIPEMACRLYGYEWLSYFPFSIARKISLVSSIAFLLASTWSWIFLILSGVSIILFTIFIVLSNIEDNRRRNNRVYYSLIMYKKPIVKDGLKNLVDRYVHDSNGYFDGKGSVYIMTHFFRGRIYLPKVTNTSEWQSNCLLDAIRLYSIPYIRKFKDTKVHLDEADRELKPLLDELSRSFYKIIGSYSKYVEKRYSVEVLEGKLNKYQNLSEGAVEALDFDTKNHADKMVEETRLQLIDSKELLRVSEYNYFKKIEDYESQIKEIEDIASRVPGIVAKTSESKALEGLSFRKDDIEKILDYKESLIELN